MKNYANKILVLGIGNSGRSDDGLGWAFLDALGDQYGDILDLEYRYQLQIEDAELVTHYDRVVFVDAHQGVLPGGFLWKKCLPKDNQSFSSHELSPDTIVYLTQSVYDKEIDAYILGIQGEYFELKIGLSDKAKSNLKEAILFFKESLVYT